MVSGWATVPASIAAHYFDEHCCRGCGQYQSACGSFDLTDLSVVKPFGEMTAPPCSRCVRRAEQWLRKQAKKNV